MVQALSYRKQLPTESLNMFFTEKFPKMQTVLPLAIRMLTDETWHFSRVKTKPT
jgi:lambda repressor-like predicted transcriptional regulator